MIVSAAVRITTLDGEVKTIPVHRHGDAYAIMAMFDIKRDKTKDVQGFLMRLWDPEDEFNYRDFFLTREEALEHAFACGQIDKSTSDTELYSEDLW